MLLSTLQKRTYKSDKSLTAAVSAIRSVCKHLVESRNGMGLRTVFRSSSSLFMDPNVSSHHSETCLQLHLSCWSAFLSTVRCNRCELFTLLTGTIFFWFKHFWVSTDISTSSGPNLCTVVHLSSFSPLIKMFVCMQMSLCFLMSLLYNSVLLKRLFLNKSSTSLKLKQVAFWSYDIGPKGTHIKKRAVPVRVSLLWLYISFYDGLFTLCILPSDFWQLCVRCNLEV